MITSIQPYSFFFELPLYTKIKIDDNNTREFYELMNFKDRINAYNLVLKENTTYTVRLETYGYGDPYDISSYVGFNKFELTCVRSSYLITYFINLEEITHENGDESYILQKVGQLPSIADLHISKIKTYTTVLSREKVKELTRAIGLAANGIGIGSFVYLRRIFEDLIAEAYQVAIGEGKLDAEAFNKAKMDSKIILLREYLPDFLVENRTLYSILSIGIHALNEQECLSHFEVVRLGIELILDEKIEKINKQNRIKEANQKIQAAKNQISKNGK